MIDLKKQLERNLEAKTIKRRKEKHHDSIGHKPITTNLCNFNCFHILKYEGKLHFIFAKTNITVITTDENFNNMEIKKEIKPGGIIYSIIHFHTKHSTYLVVGTWSKVTSVDLGDYSKKVAEESFRDYAYDMTRLEGEELNYFAIVCKGSVIICFLEDDGEIVRIRDICEGYVAADNYMLRCYQTKHDLENVIVFGEGVQMINWKTAKYIAEIKETVQGDCDHDTIGVISYIREEKEYFVVEDLVNEKSDHVMILCYDPSTSKFLENQKRSIHVGKLSVSPYWLRDFGIINNRFLVISIQTELHEVVKKERKQIVGEDDEKTFKYSLCIFNIDYLHQENNEEKRTMIDLPHAITFFRFIEDPKNPKNTLLFGCKSDRTSNFGFGPKSSNVYSPILMVQSSYLERDSLEIKDFRERLEFMVEKMFEVSTEEIDPFFKDVSSIVVKIDDCVFSKFPKSIFFS